MAFGVLGFIALLVLLFVIGYLTTSIPSPNQIALAQTTVIYANDGHTVLGHLGPVNRIVVPLSQVPRPVQRAVLAAEDRHYYSEPGISVPGIARALWVDVTGGDTQGGSTITQQYVKNAYLSQARTFTRKIREVFMAIKLDHTRSKNRVLQDYLNVIYFGRGAYGIEAAAQAYFGTDVSHLNVAQGAVLAAAIRAPGIYDPYRDRAAAHTRWTYVINGMVTMHWLSPDAARTLHYPHVLAPKGTGGSFGPDGFIATAAERELNQHGFAIGGGYRVITTIDPNMQRAAITAENQLHAAVPGPVSALVAVAPGTGAIRAYYGGADYGNPKVAGSFVDLAQAKVSPGSSFKPYVLLAALQHGIGLNTIFDGSSPKQVPGYGSTGLLYNSGNEQCRPCPLTLALARSINTVFVPLAIRVGTDQVRMTAQAAGVREPLAANGVTNAGIAIGEYDVTPLDQATGFATIAAQGVAATSFLVARVETRSGRTVYTAHPKATRVFPQAVTAQATAAMEQVLTNPQGTAYGKTLSGGRPAAGKTGTSTYSNGPNSPNRDAWFVGFTPQLSTAVWLGNLNGAPLPTGNGEVFGGGPPASAWQTFMNLALAGAPVVPFPAPNGGVTSTSPGPSVSATPSTAKPSRSSAPLRSPSPVNSPPSLPPSAPPSQSPSPTPSQSPSPSPSPTISSSGAAGTPTPG